MKKSIKFLLVAALTVGATSLFAQKMGRIDYMDVIQAMPEMTEVQAGVQKVQSEYEEHLEGLQVELNNKINDFQKLPATTSESVKQLKTREIQELQTRYSEYLQLAQEGLDKAQTELMAPLQEKADAAIKKICKADGITVVYQNGSMVYLDETAISDITAKVKTELGIK